MTKQQLIDSIGLKKGFVRIIVDSIAPDNIAGDSIEKRYFIIETINTNGTAGNTAVYYLLDKVNDVAKFYNVEPEFFDHQELSTEAKKQEALEKYLAGKYNAYFLSKIDYVNNWASATVYSLNTGKLVKKEVLVFKQGTNPINDLDVI